MEALEDAVQALIEGGMRGDRIVNGDYDLLGYEGLRFDGAHGATDWHLDPVSGRRANRGPTEVVG